MYGFICKEDDCEWWVRRKEKGKPKVVISREYPYRITEYEIDYAVSDYCQCPRKVKEIAKELMNTSIQIVKEGIPCTVYIAKIL